MFDRFSDSTRRAMGLAREATLAGGRATIDVEDLFIGLADSGGHAASVQGVIEAASRIRGQVRSGDRHVDSDPPNFTQRAMRSLEKSLEVASVSGHNFIGSLHVLYGVIDSCTDLVFESCEAEGVTQEEVLEQIRVCYGRKKSPADPMVGMDEHSRHLFEGVLRILDQREPDLADIVRRKGLEILSPALRGAVVQVLVERLAEAEVEFDSPPSQRCEYLRSLIAFVED
ncbi:MAG: hypothetical protein KDB53_07755 [Planctomycetes bacterium]|nr:hypothetical protein [Planctomycetota bacterium]